MTTLDDVIQIQKDSNILVAPAVTTPVSNAKEFAAQTSTTLNIALRNNTSSSSVYAYISGLASDNNNAVYMLQSDGQTVHYPTSPATVLQAVGADCAIKLGAPGTTTTIAVPQTAGGRIWFAKDSTLTFLVNPGPALVEPSVTNVSDPNYNIYWDFCEFTFNSFQLFVNITYVDFVSLPIALQLENTVGTVTTIEGFPADGLDTVCTDLQTQDAVDSAGWSKLIVPSTTGANLRALSPNSGITMNNALFNNYFQPYVNEVWAKYATSNLSLDTQSSYGVLTGCIDASTSKLAFGDVGGFAQPSAADIFSCSTGAFGSYSTNTDEMANIGARLAAAFNRSTLLINPNQPDAEVVSSYYSDTITNHYSRICHAANLDKLGYAFPYDDVSPSAILDQSGALYDPNPKLLTVTVGGPSTTAAAVRLRDMTRGGRQMPGGRRGRAKRDLVGWGSAEEKALLVAAEEGADGLTGKVDEDVDLEAGPSRKLSSGQQHGEPLSSSSSLMAKPLTSLVPHAWVDRAEIYLQRLEDSPLYASMKPVVDGIVKIITTFLSLSVRALVSRVSMVVFLFVFYLLLPLVRGGAGGELDVSGAAATSMMLADAVNGTAVIPVY